MGGGGATVSADPGTPASGCLLDTPTLLGSRQPRVHQPGGGRCEPTEGPQSARPTSLSQGFKCLSLGPPALSAGEADEAARTHAASHECLGPMRGRCLRGSEEGPPAQTPPTTCPSELVLTGPGAGPKPQRTGDPTPCLSVTSGEAGAPGATLPGPPSGPSAGHTRAYLRCSGLPSATPGLQGPGARGRRPTQLPPGSALRPPAAPSQRVRGLHASPRPFLTSPGAPSPKGEAACIPLPRPARLLLPARPASRGAACRGRRAALLSPCVSPAEGEVSAEEEGFENLNTMASTFIVLFLLSLFYSTTVTLFKVGGGGPAPREPLALTPTYAASAPAGEVMPAKHVGDQRRNRRGAPWGSGVPGHMARPLVLKSSPCPSPASSPRNWLLSTRPNAAAEHSAHSRGPCPALPGPAL